MLQPMGDCADTLGRKSFLFSLMVNELTNDGNNLRAYAATLTNVEDSVSVSDTVVTGRGRSTGTSLFSRGMGCGAMVLPNFGGLSICIVSIVTL